MNKVNLFPFEVSPRTVTFTIPGHRFQITPSPSRQPCLFNRCQDQIHIACGYARQVISRSFGNRYRRRGESPCHSGPGAEDEARMSRLLIFELHRADGRTEPVRPSFQGWFQYDADFPERCLGRMGWAFGLWAFAPRERGSRSGDRRRGESPCHNGPGAEDEATEAQRI